MMLFGSFGQIRLIDLTSFVNEFPRFFAHADGQCFFRFDALFFGVFADVLGDLN